MKKIAVVGTGIMGAGIAANYLKNGYEVVVWNRSPEKLESLLKQGAMKAKTPKEAAQSADILFEVTADDESSRLVWLGDEGILAGARKNAVLITSGTFSVGWVDELANTCKEQGFVFFDVPLTGSRVGAETGTLTLLAGGDEARLEELKPDLEAISKKVFYFGPAGSGIRYKLLLNMLQAIHVEGLAEVLKLASKMGMDVNKVGDALVDRPGGVSTGLAWQGYQEQPDPINFSVEWITKDLRYAKEMADAVGSVATPLLEDTLQRYQEAVEKGKGEEDWTTITKD